MANFFLAKVVAEMKPKAIYFNHEGFWKQQFLIDYALTAHFIKGFLLAC